MSSNKSNNNKKIKIKDDRNKSRIFIFSIIFAMIILSVLVILYQSMGSSKINTISKYIPTNSRTSYIIKDATEELLKPYYDNKNILVIAFASWCHNCNDEKDSINTFMKNNPDVEVIMVSHDENKADVEKYLQENDLNWFVIFDSKKTIRYSLDPESTSIPHTFLVDKTGKVLNSHKGTLTLDNLTRFYNGEKID